MAHDVVISYSRRNRDVADRFVELLRARGLDVWYDRMIRTGADWRDEIATAIAGSRCFVILFSSESNASEELRKEYSIAERRDLLIIPIRIENVEPSGFFEYELSRRQWFDAFANRNAELEIAAGQVADALKPPAVVQPSSEPQTKVEPAPKARFGQPRVEVPPPASPMLRWQRLILPGVSLLVGLYAPVGFLVWPVLQIFMVYAAAADRPYALAAKIASYTLVTPGLAFLAGWSLGFREPDGVAEVLGRGLVFPGFCLTAFLAFQVFWRRQQHAAIWLATALGSTVMAFGVGTIGHSDQIVWWTIASAGMTIANVAYFADVWQRANNTEP